MISSSSTTRDLPISAEEVTEDFAGAMETLTPSTVTSNLSIQQPKIEIDLCSQDDLNLLPFQQLETQLLDSMEIAEQQSSKSQLLEVFDDEHMEEVDGNIKMLSPGDNSTCMDDIPPTRGENQPVILGTSSTSTASNAINAPALKIGFNQRLKHSDRLRKYVREYGKMPIIFLKKDGHPTGKHASVFMTELGIAVKNIVPFQISSWKDVTKEQKQRICDTLESSFVVDFGSGPTSVRKETERLMNVRFRNNRRYMHQHYKTLTHLPWEERLKCIPTEYCESEADWEFMCTLFESEDFKKKSAVNSENARSPFSHDRVSKPLTQCKYDEVARSIGPDPNPGNGWLRESATIANIGSDNHDDGSRSLEGMDAANRAGDQVRENRAGCTFGLSNGTESENAKSTSTDDAIGTVTKAELRNALASTQMELHSTKMSLQTTQEKVRILEVNQKRLEERMEANERVMKQVFERIASDITQSLTQLPSSAPRL